MTVKSWTIKVKGYLPIDDRMEERLRRVAAEIASLPESALEVDEDAGVITIDYAQVRDRFEKSHSALRVVKAGERIVVKPPWEDYEPQSGEIVIEIDPGEAFGSGLHESTVLCLRAIEKYAKPGFSVIDFGTGAGVLAIAAAMFGASKVAAIDAREPAACAARANIERNHVSERVEVVVADSLEPVDFAAELIVANIVPKTIIAHADEIFRKLASGGMLIASGITEKQSAGVVRGLASVGFEHFETLADGGWVALIMKKGGIRYG